MLTTRLQGELVIPPSVPEGFVASLVVALAKIHELTWASECPLPAYESYFDHRGRRGGRPPRWSIHPERWEHVFEILESPAPSTSTGFVHRDYHPAQMLFEGSRVTGIYDWLTACRGPHGIDLARMRLNLAEGKSVEMAEEFRTSYRALVGEERVDPCWDLLDAADVLLDLPDRSRAQVCSYSAGSFYSRTLSH
jgi:aminoglycoside phosphotransferase (APT) family kinase protein